MSWRRCGGVSFVTAVTEAEEKEIEREKESQRKRKLMAEWLMKISRETGPMMNDGKTSKELMDELYDRKRGFRYDRRFDELQ